MPKKSRRTKAKRRAMMAKATQEARSAQAKPPASQSPTSPLTPPRPQQQTSGYEHVLPELKRIAVIAGAIIAIIVILSVVLPLIHG